MPGNLYPEFFHGANTMVTPSTINFDAPVRSPVKPDEFSGVVLDQNTADPNLANPATNEVQDFKHPESKETIPVKASLNGMV
jgi:hypothetical protein